MRSASADRQRAAASAALLACALAGLPAHAYAQDAVPPAAGAASAQAQAIAGAVATLAADPRLAGVKKTHTLRWNPDPDTDPPFKPDLSWLAWLKNFVIFLNDTSRILLYGLVAVIVAVLLVTLRRFVQLRSVRRRATAGAAVSHVRELDVRPESLPDDVGAAAWTLWRAGRVAAALSLLYRGALSRLIHRHAVPISAATTEGECLELARDRLEPVALRYVTQLVRAWEAAIYGNRALSDAMGEALCSGFATRFDSTPAAAAAPAASTAGAEGPR